MPHIRRTGPEPPKSIIAERLLRVAAALMALYFLRETLMGIGVIHHFELRPPEPLWFAAVLHIAHDTLSVGLLVSAVVGWRWSLWLLLGVQLLRILFGQVFQIYDQILSVGLIASLLAILYALFLARHYFFVLKRRS